ncbi:MAG: hypothetical protein HC831_27795 [Chloroflexia bacterium]|nr:hypothetical protein [Chloroflexia bacterium]
MRKLINIAILTLTATNFFAQGDLASLERPVEEFSTDYNGAENYLKRKVFLYIGQTLRFKCDSRLEQKDDSFVLGFTEDYKIEKDKYGLIYPKTYHPSSGGLGTDYHKIANNLFKVLDVLPHPKADSNDNKNKYNNMYYLKMQNLTLGDIVYYEYIAEDKERYFPFVATKHMNYMRNQYKGHFFQVVGERFETVEATCFKTRDKIQINGKTWWKCVDFITDKNTCELSLILESQDNQIIVPAIFVEYIFKKE